MLLQPIISLAFLLGAIITTGISIFDLSGRELRNIEIGLESEIISLNLADFLPGTYLIRVESGETTSTRKFIKK